MQFRFFQQPFTTISIVLRITSASFPFILQVILYETDQPQQILLHYCYGTAHRCTALHLCLKPVSDAPAASGPAGKKIRQLEVFRYPLFRKMIPANLMRGLGYGTTTIFAAIALDLGFDQSVSTALVSAQSIAALAGCSLVGVCLTFMAPRFVTLAGSLTFALIPLMLIPNKFVFLAVFVLVYLGRTLVDYSVPAILRAAIPVQIAGPFDAWRMLLHNAGTLIATTIAAFIPVSWLLVLTVVFQLLSGPHYFPEKDLRTDSYPA